MLIIVLVHQRKSLILTLPKQKQTFLWDLLQHTLVWVLLGSVSKDFTKDEMSDISLNSTVYDFSVDDSAIWKEDILNGDEYLMKKNNIK